VISFSIWNSRKLFAHSWCWM